MDDDNLDFGEVFADYSPTSENLSFNQCIVDEAYKKSTYKGNFAVLIGTGSFQQKRENDVKL